jgi:hypothetical protein
LCIPRMARAVFVIRLFPRNSPMTPQTLSRSRRTVLTVRILLILLFLIYVAWNTNHPPSWLRILLADDALKAYRFSSTIRSIASEAAFSTWYGHVQAAHRRRRDRGRAERDCEMERLEDSSVTWTGWASKGNDITRVEE